MKWICNYKLYAPRPWCLQLRYRPIGVYIVSNMSNQVIASAKECETQWRLGVWCLYLLLRTTNITQSGLYVYTFLVTLFCTLWLHDCVVWRACEELTTWQVDRVTSWLWAGEKSRYQGVYGGKDFVEQMYVTDGMEQQWLVRWYV